LLSYIRRKILIHRQDEFRPTRPYQSGLRVDGLT